MLPISFFFFAVFLWGAGRSKVYATGFRFSYGMQPLGVRNDHSRPLGTAMTLEITVRVRLGAAGELEMAMAFGMAARPSRCSMDAQNG